MIFHHIIPLITTAKDDDDSYKTIFFDSKEQKLKFQVTSGEEWRNQLDVNKAVVVMMPGTIGIIASFFPNAMTGKYLSLILSFLFLLIGNSCYYLTNKSMLELANNEFARTVENPSEYLRDHISRLYLNLILVFIVVILSIGAIIYFFSKMIVFGISFTEIIYFLIASFMFWMIIFQPVFERIKIYRSLMKKENQK